MASPMNSTLLSSASRNIEGVSEHTKSSPYVLFLDIDGVLYIKNPKVFQKVAELFPDATTPYNNRVCSIAAAHFFDTTAVENLNFLLREIEKIRPVWIVVSSSWRENRSVEELRETFFGMHEFSRYIVDKTPEFIERTDLGNYCPSKSHSERHSSQCRAAEIQCWLKEHPFITDFTILDDIDEHLRKAFGDRFVRTYYTTLLTKQSCESILLQHVSLV